jgi:VWFA-related protein
LLKAKKDETWAEAELKEALSLGQPPEVSMAHIYLINLYLRRSDRARAREHAEAYLREVPNAHNAQEIRDIMARIQAQQQPEKPEEEPVRIEAAEVVVDVIVTDKKNRMITNLTPADFEVFEDGVKQTLSSVRLIHRIEARPVEPGAEVAPTEPSPPPRSVPIVPRGTANLIALVFDNLSLSPDSRLYANRAAQDYIEKAAADDRLAIFGTDTRLYMVQPFTDDKKVLKQAIDQVTTGTSRQFASSASAIERVLESGNFGEGKPLDIRLGVAEEFIARLTQGGINITADNVGALMDAVLLNTLLTFQAFEAEAQGRATVLSLLSIIHGLQLLPGRKSLIFFSEGFALSSNLWPQFQTVVSAANRANVAIYTIDAGGLRVESESQRAGRELMAIAEARARGATPDLVRGGETIIDRATRVGRTSEGVLTELAASTGGLAIGNTNDLRAGLDRIDEDLRSYYLLRYAPSNQSFDGRFRTIEVKVNRPDTNVRARTGYFALRSKDTAPIFAFEQPLFELLARPSPPQDFTLKLGALHFPTATPAVTASVVAQIPSHIISFSEVPPEVNDQKKKKKPAESKMYVGELDVMALVKDARGVIVRKLSQNYKLSYPAEQLEKMKQSTVLFHRKAPVVPGTYQIEIVARDVNSGRASATRTTLHVPAPSSSALDISSIVPTKGGEPLQPQERDGSHPLHYGQSLVIPNFDRAFSKATDKEVMFYFTVQATPGASVRVRVEFLQGGRVLAQAPGALPAPDANGRIQLILPFPLASFPEGAYDVRITVNDGTHRASEHTSFSVVN